MIQRSGQAIGWQRAVCELETVRLWDAWSRFVRQAIILSAVGCGVTLTGIPLQPANGITTVHDVLPKLRSRYSKAKPPWWEPNWGLPRQGIDAASLLGISNVATVTAALGATPSPIDQLRLTRNFVAHRNHASAFNAIAEIGSIVPASDFDALNTLRRPTSGGVLLHEYWVIYLIATAEAALQ